MKQYSFIRIILLLLLLKSNFSTQAQIFYPTQVDSVNISLLTCDPGNKPYSLYGHTAIRVNDNYKAQDLVVNYGMFSFQKPYFALRFTFGLTDYEMGIETWNEFKEIYLNNGRSIVEQELNLNTKEKVKLLKLLDENYREENRIYRYNFLYDNCTTRARDIILSSLDRKTEFRGDSVSGITYRSLIHQYSSRNTWGQFGNDILLGVKADKRINRVEQEFIPNNLKKDFSYTYMIEDSTKRFLPLIVKENTYFATKAEQTDNIFLTSPLVILSFIATLVIVITLWEKKNKKKYRFVDTIIFLTTGLIGILLTAMIFSQHPTVSFNLQILMLSPVNLFFVYSTTKKQESKLLKKWKTIYCACCLLFFILGTFEQEYAIGLQFMAFSLLFRYSIEVSFRRYR